MKTFSKTKELTRKDKLPEPTHGVKEIVQAKSALSYLRVKPNPDRTTDSSRKIDCILFCLNTQYATAMPVCVCILPSVMCLKEKL